MSRQYLTFAGTNLADFGVYISGSGVYNAPEREYEEITVPGRDGTLFGNEKRLMNVELTYPAFMYANFSDNARALRSFLLSKVGYQRLADTYHPDEFRLAVFRGGTEFDMLQNLKAGNFDLTFDCKPQRFLVSGETVRTFSGSGTIENPTLFTAKPMIRVYGTGTFSIGSTEITILSVLPAGYTDFDCELMDAFCGDTLRNFAVQIAGNDFPSLPPGESAITLGSGITSIEITPRWFTV